MNIRKPVDYSAMRIALDTLLMTALPQMELYYEIGRLVSSRPEKAPQSPPLNISAKLIPMSPASPPGISAGCGIFIWPIRILRGCWPRP